MSAVVESIFPSGPLCVYMHWQYTHAHIILYSIFSGATTNNSISLLPSSPNIIIFFFLLFFCGELEFLVESPRFSKILFFLYLFFFNSATYSKQNTFCLFACIFYKLANTNLGTACFFFFFVNCIALIFIYLFVDFLCVKN